MHKPGASGGQHHVLYHRLGAHANRAQSRQNPSREAAQGRHLPSVCLQVSPPISPTDTDTDTDTDTATYKLERRHHMNMWLYACTFERVYPNVRAHQPRAYEHTHILIHTCMRTDCASIRTCTVVLQMIVQSYSRLYVSYFGDKHFNQKRAYIHVSWLEL